MEWLGYTGLAAAAVLLGAQWCGAAQPPATQSLSLEARTFTPPPSKDVLRYRYGKPADVQAGQRYPLLVCLHGAGERGDDNDRQVGHFLPLLRAVTAATPCYVVIPQVPAKEIWATQGWSAGQRRMQERPSPAMAMTKALLDQIMASEAVDRDRVYITGLSMGGYGTWEMIQRWPDLFAAAVPICGGGDTEQVAKLVGLPIWAWHGEADTAVKVEETRRMIDALIAAGGKPRATYLPREGHLSWVPAYKDPELARWLLAQRRGQAPPATTTGGRP